MSEAQRQSLLAMLGQGPSFGELSLADLRAMYNQMGAITPLPAGAAHRAENAGGVPVEIGAIGDEPTAATILFFHGGGYSIGSLESHRGMLAALGEAAGARTVAVNYRLAPEHPFPAALDDALAAYRWLLESGVDPHSVAFAGDSAGGGLAVATLVRARDEGLPLPACAVLFSPFTDLAGSGETMTLKAADDVMVTAEVLDRLSAGYIGGADAANPAISPIHADLRGLPPLFVFVGTAEVLIDDSVRLARKAMLGDVAVRLEAWPRLPHVWPMFAGILDEGREALVAAGTWIAQQTGASAK